MACSGTDWVSTKGVKVIATGQDLCNLRSSYYSTKGNAISDTLRVPQKEPSQHIKTIFYEQD